MPRETKLNKQKLFIELKETINAIPSGVYTLVQRDENGALLAVGDKIYVSLLGDLEPYLVLLPDAEGRERQMGESEFLDRYYSLLDNLKNVPPDCSRPLTVCTLHPSLARETH